MNCPDCQENLVAYVEGLLDEPETALCREHLQACPACQAEHQATTQLHRQLVEHGRAVAAVSLAPRVMARIRGRTAPQPSTAIGWPALLRWLTGLGAATAVVVVALFFLSPRGTATAAGVMTRGMQAALRLSTVHLQCRIRSKPAENFAHLDPSQAFTAIELWKEFEAPGRWRIEKPQRAVVMDGEATLLFIQPLNVAMKVPPVQAKNGRGPFDTGWLHAVADIEQALVSELHRAHAQGWPMEVSSETDASGAVQAVVTIQASSGLPADDYLQNKFFQTANTRRVYRFNDQSGRLEGVQFYLQDQGAEVLVFEVTRITYNETFDPAIFRLELPQEVVWQNDRQVILPDNAQYASLSAEDAARAFFEACTRADWDEAAKFWPLPVDARLQQFLGGLKLVGLGQSFTSAAYPGRFVPYEIVLKDGTAKKHNLALKKDKLTGRWFVDGGL